ncbi:MAG: hypothetical protein L0H15_04370, partial [Nitrosospira sp.]|nr:hypothetical protein [Nitrosospira sp.]
AVASQKIPRTLGANLRTVHLSVPAAFYREFFWKDTSADGTNTGTTMSISHRLNVEDAVPPLPYL